MTDTQAGTMYYTNQLGRIFLGSLQEIIGQNGLSAVLNQASLSDLILKPPANDLELGFPFEYVSGIQVALENIYGVRGGRGVALRSGRTFFKQCLREYSTLLKFSDTSFRLSPLEIKLEKGVGIFADIFDRYSDHEIRIENTTQDLSWVVTQCSFCWQRHAEVSVCHFLVGILQEITYWVSGGKIFHIIEKECVAKGDSVCKIMVDKHYYD